MGVPVSRCENVSVFCVFLCCRVGVLLRPCVDMSVQMYVVALLR